MIGNGWRTRISQIFFLLLCAETIFSVPFRSVMLATRSTGKAWIAAIIVCVAMAIVYRTAQVPAWIKRALTAKPFGLRSWLSFWLVTGLTMRLAWAMQFRVVLQSDGLAYFRGAELLATQHRYDGAFWPPGFSLFLTPFLAVLGVHMWVTVVSTLLLFTLTFALTYLLAERLGGGLASRVAPMLVALWPNDIALIGVNSKEILIGCLLAGSLLLYLRSDHGSRNVRFALIALAGLLIGYAALTQPGFLLFPAAMAGMEWVRRRPLLPALGRLLLFSAVMVLTVLPWTYRNYLTFHRLVPISTNGGSVFYRANNPKANASYSEEGEQVLPKDEFAADQEGYRAAREWIEHHPDAFLKLAVRKQVVYLGDDGIGVYESMKRRMHPRAKVYALAKGVCNLFWLTLWIVLFLGWRRLFQLQQWPTWVAVCLLPLLYQWAIDSVFESGSRHHVPYAPLVSILVGLVLESTRSAIHDPEVSSVAASL